jgi:hypothetical protein
MVGSIDLLFADWDGGGFAHALVEEPTAMWIR